MAKMKGGNSCPLDLGWSIQSLGGGWGELDVEPWITLGASPHHLVSHVYPG